MLVTLGIKGLILVSCFNFRRKSISLILREQQFSKFQQKQIYMKGQGTPKLLCASK